MNHEQIIQKSSKIFTHFEKLEECLYKGHYVVNDKPAAIYYLNFSENVTEEDFEVIQYKYIAEEFYKHEDSLQWNIYLLFINSNISDDLRLRILTDDKYARKLIFQESEFLDYFKLEKSSHAPLPDLVSEWKDKLKSVDLQEVYSTIPYTTAIQNFLDNNTNKEDINVISDTSEVITVDEIKSIELTTNYRNYPLQRNYNFGSVNLINGVNGSGKTSLLEAIELLLTGKSFRNFSIDEIAGSVKGVYNDSFEDSYSPIEAKKYKVRDTKWYNHNYQERGNRCCVAFNQFNFFNSDAAYQFASSQHEDQINDSLKQIILGTEYHCCFV